MTTLADNQRKSFNGDWKFLSNFYPSPIEFEGLLYPTVEHAYQAAKTNNPEWRKEVQECATASKAKQLGRDLRAHEDWDDVKLSVMATLLRKKFYDPVLKAALIATGEQELCEYNYWHDVYWGKCTCTKHNSEGQNNLGRLLMELRTALCQK